MVASCRSSIRAKRLEDLNYMYDVVRVNSSNVAMLAVLLVAGVAGDCCDKNLRIRNSVDIRSFRFLIPAAERFFTCHSHGISTAQNCAQIVLRP